MYLRPCLRLPIVFFIFFATTCLTFALDTTYTFNQGLPAGWIASGFSFDTTGCSDTYCPDIEILGEICCIDSWSEAPVYRALHLNTSDSSTLTASIPTESEIEDPDQLRLQFTIFMANADNARFRITVDSSHDTSFTTFELFNLDSLRKNHAKSNKTTIRLDLPTFVAFNPTGSRINFEFTGEGFAILDDVRFYEDTVSHTSICEDNSLGITFPGYLKEKLDSLGIQYNLYDNAPAVKHQIVIAWDTIGLPPDKQDIRDSLGVDTFIQCSMDPSFELWGLGPWNATNAGGVPSSMQSIGINERVQKARSEAEINGADENWLSFNKPRGEAVQANPRLPAPLPGVPENSPDAILIGHIDVGYLLDTECTNHHLYKVSSVNFPHGWNAVDDNNNPTDREGHGAHTAGIIINTIDTLLELCSDSLKFSPYKILPIRAFANGVSDVFKLVCATSYALEKEVDVLNISAGLYPPDSVQTLILVFNRAAIVNALIVVSAGNDSVNVVNKNSYFSMLLSAQRPNILPVASASPARLSGFSNFSTEKVLIAAPGDQILSHYVGNNCVSSCDSICQVRLDGTSMSAPAVTAAAAFILAMDKSLDAKSYILNSAQEIQHLSDFVKDRKYLSLVGIVDSICTTVSVSDTNKDQPLVKIFPNPASEKVTIEFASAPSGIHTLTIFDAPGRCFLFEQKLNKISNEVDISQLPGGIYFFKIQGNSSKSIHKVFKLQRQ